MVGWIAASWMPWKRASCPALGRNGDALEEAQNCFSRKRQFCSAFVSVDFETFHLW
jgi:hypothetical protein